MTGAKFIRNWKFSLRTDCRSSRNSVACQGYMNGCRKQPPLTCTDISANMQIWVVSRLATFPPDYHSVFYAIFRVYTNHEKKPLTYPVISANMQLWAVSRSSTFPPDHHSVFYAIFAFTQIMKKSRLYSNFILPEIGKPCLLFLPSSICAIYCTLSRIAAFVYINNSIHLVEYGGGVEHLGRCEPVALSSIITCVTAPFSFPFRNMCTPLTSV